MLRTAFAGSLLALLTACASTPVPLTEAKPVPADRLLAFQAKADGTGRAVVTRDRSFQGAGCYAGFFVDGNLVGKLDPGESATFHLPAGEHIVGVGSKDGRGLCAMGNGTLHEITTVFAADQTRYYRIVTPPGDAPKLEATTLR